LVERASLRRRLLTAADEIKGVALDEELAIERVVEEAYSAPETVKSAPHRAPVPKLDETAAQDPARWAFTRRGQLAKRAAAS